MRGARRRLLAAGLFAVLLLAACGGADDAASDADAGTTPVVEDGDEQDGDERDEWSPDTEQLAADREADDAQGPAAALAWTAMDLDGGQVDGTAYAGGDVLLWMWAPWCGICNREAPNVAGLLPDYDGDVEFVGVAGRGDVEDHQRFVDRHGLDAMDTVVDADGSLWASYGVSYMPAWVLINQDGAAQVVPGELGEERLRELLDALVEA